MIIHHIYHINFIGKKINKLMKISVVIPMYNAENTIVRALDSVKNQTYKANYEIIVVNDGSKDNSQQVVEAYIAQNPELNIQLINQSNGGVSKARNIGLKNAKGEYIAFLDSDDQWLPHKTETQMKIFEKNNEVDFLGAGFHGFGIKENKGYLKKITFKNLLFRNFFQPSTILMKKEIVDKVGFFDENQRYAEEGNYFFRVSQNYQCYFLNESLIVFGDGKSGFGESGLSSNLVEMQKGELKNLKFAYKNKWINPLIYMVVVGFSMLKFLRRLIIVALR